ncbi:proline-rich receptor-like protein kinase PERK8 [Iris pallida]|uniref:Proline-rich receptor-like protein kinase PERK8 n=1 Tax=Iris pallida TaxID=29817 RepID=A0AAX6DWM0_IRIPA|nr:proline-rich receptor-like protein kinase PERK8 [Iris pallida]
MVAGFGTTVGDSQRQRWCRFRSCGSGGGRLRWWWIVHGGGSVGRWWCCFLDTDLGCDSDLGVETDGAKSAATRVWEDGVQERCSADL